VITVAILINGQPIIARSAVNRGPSDREGFTRYEVDDGSTLLHRRDDGAVALAIAMLGTVKKME
jgi:hypothetical protein